PVRDVLHSEHSKQKLALAVLRCTPLRIPSTPATCRKLGSETTRAHQQSEHLASTKFNKSQTRSCSSFNTNRLETGKFYRFQSRGIWFGTRGSEVQILSPTNSWLSAHTCRECKDGDTRRSAPSVPCLPPA